MRSALLVAALAAGCANAYEKHVYVTDWTTVTVTETVTASAVTITVPAAKQVQVPTTTTTSSTFTPPPAVNIESSSSEPPKTPTVAPVPPVSSTTWAPAPAETEGTTSYWSTAWTSSWGGASTSEVSPSATSTSTAAGSTASTAYQSAVLFNHNVHRSNHSASDLEWSASLESSAYTLAASCNYGHNTSIDGGGYGQNIGYGVTADQIGVMITNLMYNDETSNFDPYYGEANPSMTYFDSWGHFSQIVWKDTTSVGCATVTCKGLQNVDTSKSLPYTVCNYHPVGNVDGEYASNVISPGNNPKKTYVAS
ncbi:PR-1-like protein [Penicillium hispanicum]|uniref:PR-1-like protein n=1 Tax=Penicillium hispanicum TaxID=1080232 RepID=UPI002540D190|nr:PR-1-like protein [Penicillium hispanicum]KAJ5578098.1 PR-1-like protein [Penicillium hispanicum]